IDKKEFRALIKHCFFDGEEAKQWLDKRYGDFAPGKSTIIDWYAEFKRGRTNTDDAERSGRPKSKHSEQTRVLLKNHFPQCCIEACRFNNLSLIPVDDLLIPLCPLAKYICNQYFIECSIDDNTIITSVSANFLCFWELRFRK
ncbi:hypothetical protein WN51_02903, partial [Melipona quadrifasciata]